MLLKSTKSLNYSYLLNSHNKIISKCITRSKLQYKRYSTSNTNSHTSTELDSPAIPTQSAKSQNTTESCLPCITDPLVIYRSYVSRGILQPDLNQLRCMVEFQKLYDELKDYQPDSLNDILINDYIDKLKECTKQLDESIPLDTNPIETQGVTTNESESNQGIFKNLNLSINQIINKNKIKKTEKIKNELIKILTDEEKFTENIKSPKGLIINGTVGSGKSLLMDIFANSLPIKSKRRWHYNNFILWVYSEIHNLQLRQTQKKFINFKKYSDEIKDNLNDDRLNPLNSINEFILYEISKKLIKKNSILILDEFMLPDISSAKIIKTLFNIFFKLGGVLIATTNKLPENLYSNEFNKEQFKDFEKILNLRCKIIRLDNDIDYRILLSNLTGEKENLIKSLIVVKEEDELHDKNWENLKKSILASDKPIESQIFKSYGRLIKLPVYEIKDSILDKLGGNCTIVEFEQLINGKNLILNDSEYGNNQFLSTADYLSITSRFNIIIIDNIPKLTVNFKNEIRNFINFIDCAYDSKCKIIIRSEVSPDRIFFDDLINSEVSDTTGSTSNILQVLSEETYSKAQMDITNPYRPNVQSYEDGSNEYETKYDNEDTFKEETTCNNTKSIKESKDFKNLSNFIGEDEIFAYKRAISRIIEMTSSETWINNNNWMPLDSSMRPWEDPQHDSKTE
ncbi:unnamed protein product [[Candida] boidinii]|uniref:Unnamed protein product n=1 Tax=Candida boidinii TaxID=5477 RepID=A0A9W6WFG7_CANBO|nr:unnamed protein product [[Candida] boidinii]